LTYFVLIVALANTSNSILGRNDDGDSRRDFLAVDIRGTHSFSVDYHVCCRFYVDAFCQIKGALIYFFFAKFLT
jgi:hypothetical protein